MRTMRIKTTALLLTAATLAGCGGVYQISRYPGFEGTRADFRRDELLCNQRNFFVFSGSADASQTIYMTKQFMTCMTEKGWKYSLKERKFSLMKQAGA